MVPREMSNAHEGRRALSKSSERTSSWFGYFHCPKRDRFRSKGFASVLRKERVLAKGSAIMALPGKAREIARFNEKPKNSFHSEGQR